MRKGEDPTPEPIRKMPDGTPCWCVSDDEAHANWIHSPRCGTIRALKGYDFTEPQFQGRRRNAIARQKKVEFLADFRQHGNITTACETVHIERNTYYRWMEHDERFALGVNVALEESIDRMEKEALRRGLVGVEKPVYQGGREVGKIQEYSDTLLIFMMKGARPGKYRERGFGQQDINEETPAPVGNLLEGKTEAERAQIRAWLDAALAQAEAVEVE